LILIDHFYQALQERIKAIRKARSRIVIEPHHFNPDSLGVLLISEIIDAKRRHPELRVQILLDYWGSHNFSPELALMMKGLGIEIKYFNYPAIYQFWQLNLRTHRKIFVADDQVFIGGFNLSENFFGLNSEINFLDREISLTGFFADQANEAVQKLWNSVCSCNPEQVLNWDISWMPWSWKIQDNSFLRHRDAEKIYQRILNFKSEGLDHEMKSSRPEKFEVETSKIELHFDQMPVPGKILNWTKSDHCAEVFLELLENAQKKVDLESLYFLPTSRLQGVLLKKLSEGVKVNVLTNGVDSMDNESGEILSLSLKYFDELLRRKAKLWGIKGRSWPNRKKSQARLGSYFATHAKSYVFDNNTYIGSLNIDPRSFETNLESAVLIRNERAVAAAVRRSLRYRQRQFALPMTPWAQLVRPGALVGRWTSVKTIKYLALSGLRKIIEPYY